MKEKPQLHPLLGIKSSRTRRKIYKKHCRHEDNVVKEDQTIPENSSIIRLRHSVCTFSSNSKCEYYIINLITINNFKKNVTKNFKPCSSSTFLVFLLTVILSIYCVNATTNLNSSSLSPPIPTTISQAYSHIPKIPINSFPLNKGNISRSAISRPFYTRMTPRDAKVSSSSSSHKLNKPSKLFTNNENDKETGFNQEVFDSTTEKVIQPSSTTTRKSSAFSPFLTHTDTGPKIRLEPFFNILSTFQSLALGSSKEQKFSPSYQAVSESMGLAEAQLKAKKEQRNKGTKGMRLKNPLHSSTLLGNKSKNKTNKQGKGKNNKGKIHSENENDDDSGGGPVKIPIPKPLIVVPFTQNDHMKINPSTQAFPQFSKIPTTEDGDIITADSLQQEQQQHVAPMDVLSVSMSTSMNMGGSSTNKEQLPMSSTTPKSKGTVESVKLTENDAETLKLLQIVDRHRHDANEHEPIKLSITEPSLGIPGISPKKKSSSSKKQGKKKQTTIKNNNSTLALENGPESRERRLRYHPHQQHFENFHQTDSDSDLQADESFSQPSPSPNTVITKTNILPGYALPTPDSDLTSHEKNVRQLIRDNDVHIKMISKYPVSFIHAHENAHPLPPPGLGIPPKSFFSLNKAAAAAAANVKRPSFRFPNDNQHLFEFDPNENIKQKQNNYGNSIANNLQTNHQQSIFKNKPPEASSDLSEQQNAADSTLAISVNNPHQKIGIMDGFDLFFKQYKVLVWGGFFVITALALLSVIVFLWTNNPPTEVVTAKGFLSDWLSNPDPSIANFLSSLVQVNEKGGYNGKRRRKRYKMQKKEYKNNDHDGKREQSNNR